MTLKSLPAGCFRKNSQEKKLKNFDFEYETKQNLYEFPYANASSIDCLEDFEKMTSF